MKILAIIPARAGSKGLPGKNILPLHGKPLIYWSIDAARGILADEDICVSTDSEQIADVARQYGLQVPFLRPPHLARDTSSTVDVLLHALDFYRQQGRHYDVILLLQPTSPLRTAQHITEAISLYSPSIDMVVSVKRSHAAAVIVKQNERGFLESVLNKEHLGRQSFDYWEYNGAIYVINVSSLVACGALHFEKIIKYEMSDRLSIDIDTDIDMFVAEKILESRK